MKFYFTPTKKGSGGNSFSHAEGGHKTFWGGGGRKSFSPLLGGVPKRFTPSCGGEAQTKNRTRDFPVLYPPPPPTRPPSALPVTNDMSLVGLCIILGFETPLPLCTMPYLWPSTPEIDRATWPFLKFDM